MDAALNLNMSTELAVLSSFLDLDEFEVVDSTKDRAGNWARSRWCRRSRWVCVRIARGSVRSGICAGTGW